VRGDGLPDDDGKHPMKIERRKMKIFRERFKAHRFVEVIVDIFKRLFDVIEITRRIASDRF